MTLRKIHEVKRIESLLIAIKQEETPEILVKLEKTGEDNYENFIFIIEKKAEILLEFLEF